MVNTVNILFTDAAITVGMILLIESGKRKSDVRRRRIMLVVGLGMFALFFGMILSIFKSKASGYPYSFILG
jgi:oligosaccharyltransferase complex subunit gamma